MWSTDFYLGAVWTLAAIMVGVLIALLAVALWPKRGPDEPPGPPPGPDDDDPIARLEREMADDRRGNDEEARDRDRAALRSLRAPGYRRV
jgi:hypothetical protein